MALFRRSLGNYSNYQRYSPSSSPAPTASSPGSTGANTTLSQQLAIEDIPGLIPLMFYSATNANGQMLIPGAAAAISLSLPYRGSIVALSVNASASDTGTYTAFLNGSSTTLVATLSSATAAIATKIRGNIPFAAGSNAHVTISGASGVNPVVVVMYLAVDPSTVL